MTNLTHSTLPVAVIGAGGAGLYASRLLEEHHEVTLFEAADKCGGHANTVTVEINSEKLAVDVGFMVYNSGNYPLFCKLLDELNIQGVPTTMSFSVHDVLRDIEYNGGTWLGLLADKKNLLKSGFWRMLYDIVLFNYRAKRDLIKQNLSDNESFGSYLQRSGYGELFTECYCLAMGAEIWSCGKKDIKFFPARFVLEFFDNHGLLQIFRRPQWLYIPGGSQRYIENLLKGLKTKPRTGTKVVAVTSLPDGVRLFFTDGHSEDFSKVVISTHSDEALALLKEPSKNQRDILGAIKYVNNKAILHTDTSLLPPHKLAWAGWNYALALDKEKNTHYHYATYNLTMLQHLKTTATVCLTFNEGISQVAQEHVLDQLDFNHPIIDTNAYQAQQKFKEINHETNIYFCGAYWYNGFHEDAIRSAYECVQQLLA